MEHYEQLKAFKQEHGHCYVPSTIADTTFSNWCTKVRKLWIKRLKTGQADLFPDTFVDLLVAVGMGDATTGPYQPYVERWEDRFNERKAHHETFGHFRVSAKENRKLFLWLSSQRQAYLSRQRLAATGVKPRAAALTDDRLQKLTALGVRLKPISLTFDDRLQQMIRYKAEHNGDTRVPVSYKALNNLGRWVTSIKTRYYEGRISADRIARLNALGFDWSRRHVQSNWKNVHHNYNQDANQDVNQDDDDEVDEEVDV